MGRRGMSGGRETNHTVISAQSGVVGGVVGFVPRPGNGRGACPQGGGRVCPSGRPGAEGGNRPPPCGGRRRGSPPPRPRRRDQASCTPTPPLSAAAPQPARGASNRAR